MSAPTGKTRVLEFLRAHRGRWYTARQIASYLRLRERTVLGHLRALQRSHGVIEREDGERQ